MKYCIQTYVDILQEKNIKINVYGNATERRVHGLAWNENRAFEIQNKPHAHINSKEPHDTHANICVCMRHIHSHRVNFQMSFGIEIFHFVSFHWILNSSHRIRRLTRLLTDKWATHHTQHMAAAAGGSTDTAVLNISGSKSDAHASAASTAGGGGIGGGGMMAKINARHWLHPTSTHSTAPSPSPSMTPPTATPLPTTPIMPLAASATGLFSPTTSATTPTPSIGSSASSSSASATATTLSSATHLQQQLQQQQQQLLASEELRRNTFYRTVCASFQSAILLLDMDTGEISDYNERLEQQV